MQPGNTVTLPLHLTNVGNEKITVTSTSIVNPGTPAAYTLASGSWMGGDLAPGQSQDVNVTFAPTTKAQYIGELDISSTDSTNIVPVPLTGFGGGAILSCTPLSLDFGTVAANIGASLPVICTNTGSDVPDHPEAGVILSTLLTDNPVYSGQVDPMSVNQANAASPLAAGQSVQVDVIYTPVATAMDVGTLKINSNVTDGTSLTPPTISLKGDAIAELPCTYTLVPATVNFGQVKPGTQIPGGFVITNTGANECLVTGLNLSASTQNVFTLTSGPVTSQRLSPVTTPPGPYPTQLNVNLEFAPQQTGSYSGAVQFTISDPTAPHQSVNLSGVGGSSCFLVSPALLDYGTVGISNGQFCANGKRKFVGVNGCAQSVTIQSATMAAGGGVYSFLSEQAPQVVAQGGTSTPFVVGFKPRVGGDVHAAARWCRRIFRPTPFGAGFSGSAVDGDTQTDKFIGHTPQVDILWVMDTDDDPAERDTIAKQARTFIDALNKREPGLPDRRHLRPTGAPAAPRGPRRTAGCCRARGARSTASSRPSSRPRMRTPAPTSSS